MNWRRTGMLLALALHLVGQTAATGWSQEVRRTNLSMRQKVYDKISKAQQAAEVNEMQAALKELGDIEGMKDLTPYERAQLYTTLGYVHFLRNDMTQSIAAYSRVLEQQELPHALKTTTLYTIAQLQFHQGNHAATINYLTQWLQVVESPGPEPFILLAQSYYQLQQFQDAVAPLQRAIEIAAQRGTNIQESWLALQRAVYHEVEDHAALLQVLEVLVTRFPKKEYWMHLAATYGDMGDERRQLATYEVAYELGYLQSGSEILLLSHLLLQANVPYRAGRILQQGLESGAVAATAEHYRLLSQAWILAHEDQQAVAALKEASKHSSDGELDARLAMSYASLREWEGATNAARAALEKGVADADQLRILLGTALYELNRLEEAKAAFGRAAQSEHSRNSALQWITYIEEEQLRQQTQSATDTARQP
jgi:tetratricopeptide (TPR) repeat protein